MVATKRDLFLTTPPGGCNDLQGVHSVPGKKTLFITHLFDAHALFGAAAGGHLAILTLLLPAPLVPGLSPC